MKKVKKWLICIFVMLSLLCIGIACASCASSKASLVKVAGATIDKEEKSVFMLVENDTESVSLVDKVVCSSDSSWKLYYDKLGQSEIPTKIAASKTGELKNGDNVFYIVVTASDESQINIYKLTVHRSYKVAINYYSNKNTLLHWEYAFTGDDYSVDYTPAIDGYTFNYWKNSEGEKTTELVPYESVSLYADCTANSYKATLDVNGGDQISSTEMTIAYDENYSFDVPVRDGYTFLGWYVGNTAVTNANGKSIVAWNFASDKTIKAKWEMTSYTVTLDQDLAEGGTVSGDGNYKYGNSVTVTASTNKGYDFLGWYNGETKLTDGASYTFTMPDANVTYTAKWKENDDLLPFTFTSTRDTLTITGVTDNNVTEIVVPDYVTSIALAAFKNCKKLQSITIPFVGDSIKTESDADRYPFGYIFGVSATGSNGTQYHNAPYSLKTVTVTGGNILSNAFAKCNYLTSVTLPNGLTSIGERAFDGCASLTNVTIPNSVKSIGAYAFYECESLTSASLPDGLTSIETYTFYGCNSLTSVSLPNGLTSIGACAFYGCSSLTSVSLPNSVKSIGDLAFQKSGLTSVTIPNGVKSFGKGVFYGCRSLTSVSLPDGLTSIENDMFSGCSSLTSVTIPDSVTSIGKGAFNKCKGLTSVTIGKGVTNIGEYAFSDCYRLVEVYDLSNLAITKGATNNGYVGYYAKDVYTSLDEKSKLTTTDDGFEFYDDGTNCYLVGYIGNETALVLPNYNGKSYEIDQYVFYECNDLTSVTLGNGVTGIGKYAFAYCNQLKSLTLGNSVTNIGERAFKNCISLTSVTFGNGVTSIEDNAFISCNNLTGVYISDMAAWCNISFGENDSNPLSYAHNLYLNGALVTELTIPNNAASIGAYAFYACTSLTSATIGNGVTTIGSEAFRSCTSLTSMTIGNSVTTIGSEAFRSCSSLEHITIPDSVTSIGMYLFFDCSGLTSVTIGDGLTSIEKDMFYGCSGLTSVTIGDGVTSIGDDAFSRLESLTSVTLGNGLTSIGGSAFSGCSSLTSVTIPNSVKSIGSDAFEGCSGLTSMSLPDGLTNIGGGAFNGCSGLTSVSLPDSLTNMGNGVFYECSGLTSVTIGKGVTNIGNKAFYNCSRLINVTIGSSVASIGQYAFYFCKNLTNVTIPNSVTSIDEFAFYGCSLLYKVTNLSDLKLTFGEASNGYIAYNAKEITDKDGNKTYKQNGYEYIETEDGFLFKKKNGSYTLIAYLGSETTITLPKDIDGNAYSIDQMGGVVNVIIPEGIASIGAYAFYYSDGLMSVTIANSVTSIGDGAFDICRGLTSVYYTGTEEEWNAIAIRSGNTYLTKATRYYYSETQPTESGNWWHYVDGVPTAW